MPGEDSDPDEEYFAEILPGRCTPTLEGFFISFGNAYRHGVKTARAENECRMKIDEAEHRARNLEIEKNIAIVDLTTAHNGVRAWLADYCPTICTLGGFILGAAIVGAVARSLK
mgnify:CR=1 FL=1